MSAVTRAWGDQLRETYGAELPENYLTFDCETTGTDLTDWPLEIGHCIVRDCRVIQQGGFVINWAKLLGGKERSRFWDQVEHIDQVMREPTRGKWRLHKKFIQKHGKHPVNVLSFYAKLFEMNREAGAFFAGHNAWRFDVPLLEGVFRDFSHTQFCFGPMEVLDTGGMEKAIQVDRPPFPDETMEEYFNVINGIYAEGVQWSMQHCMDKYDLNSREGVTEAKAHQAEQDAYCCHLLYEEHRLCH
jgi:DNA polymerase III epsilon subunit-like protein